MKYISTRDPSIQLTASQAILKGISPEGGLFVPEEFPQVDLDFIRELEGLTYWKRAERIMALYLDDFSREDLKACTEGAYRGTFDGDQPAPVRAAGDLRLLEPVSYTHLLHRTQSCSRRWYRESIPHSFPRCCQRGSDPQR